MSRWKTVVTTVGLNLLSNVTDSRAINIVSVKGGTGKVAETALEAQTAITDYKADLKITASEQTSDSNYQITARLANDSVSASFNMTQVGVYATLGDSATEVLFMIMQCGDDGDVIPASSLSKGFSATYQINMAFSNSENVNVVVSPLVEGLATVATSGSYNDLKDTPEFAPVATSGSYNDLTDKPNTGKGAAVYTINADTFAEGKTMGSFPYEEIHNCSGRIVYVGLLSDTYSTAAQESGLFLYSGSAQQGNVGIQVTSTPSTDIKLVVVDLGAFVSDEAKAVVINGLS